VTSKARELESLLLPAVAALPLYFTGSVSVMPIVVFHLALLAIAMARAFSGWAASPVALQILAAGYLLFFPVDGLILSRSLIRASAHLLFFIAVYQSADPTRKQEGKRFLVTSLIFVTSIATSTDITVVFFIVIFVFLSFRELMLLSHFETEQLVDKQTSMVPTGRAAALYLVSTVIAGSLLFPLLPRIKNPLVRGIAGDLADTSTGFSDTIDFSTSRGASSNPEVLARVWMSREASLLFSPIRLRGGVYDRFDGGRRWRAAGPGVLRNVRQNRSSRFVIGTPSGFVATAIVQQRRTRDRRLFLPSGTYQLGRLLQLSEEPVHDSYSSFELSRSEVTFEAFMSHATREFPIHPPHVLSYPASPDIALLARSIVGPATKSAAMAEAIERYMATNFKYVKNDVPMARPVPLEDFLLKTHQGHCEYFAAGMVVLLSTLNVPARVAGGYYGGEFNPLTGYFIIRQRDAHAWVEVFVDNRWNVYDPTPSDQRPGSAPGGVLGAYANALRDSVNYFWDRYILTFGIADQLALITRAIEKGTELFAAGRASVGKAVDTLFSRSTLIVVSAILAILLLGSAISRLRAPLFKQLELRMADLGIEVTSSMTTEELLEKVAREQPGLLGQVRQVVDVYRKERFSPLSSSKAERSAARQVIRDLRRSERPA